MPGAIENTFELAEARATELGLATRRYGDALLVHAGEAELPPPGDWKRVDPDTWANILGYPCPLRVSSAHRISVHYRVLNRRIGGCHLYWYNICADSQKEFDRLRLGAIDEAARIRGALREHGYDPSFVEVKFR